MAHDDLNTNISELTVSFIQLLPMALSHLQVCLAGRDDLPHPSHFSQADPTHNKEDEQGVVAGSWPCRAHEQTEY